MSLTTKYHSKQITTRFLQVMDEVTGARSAGKIPASEFGVLVGISSSNLIRMRSGGHYATLDAIAKICLNFNVYEPWLINGKGPRYYSELNQNSAKEK